MQYKIVHQQLHYPLLLGVLHSACTHKIAPARAGQRRLHAQRRIGDAQGGKGLFTGIDAQAQQPVFQAGQALLRWQAKDALQRSIQRRAVGLSVLDGDSQTAFQPEASSRPRNLAVEGLDTLVMEHGTKPLN